MRRHRSVRNLLAGVATIATVAACGVPEGGGAGAPSPTMVSGPYASTSFAVPFRVMLEFAPSPDGWEVVERRMLVTLAVAPEEGYDVVLLPRASTRLVTPGGEVALPADLIGALDELDQVDAERLISFDRGEPATFMIGAHEAPHVEVRFGDGEAGTPLLRTSQGDAIDRPADGTVWRVFDVDLPGEDDVVVIYRGGSNPGRWFGAVTDMLASFRIRRGNVKTTDPASY